MIKLENITCGYGKKSILSDINLTINKAELTCLIGKNGVGKTTLFKTILGILPQLKGSITFDGTVTNGLTSLEQAKYISYVPQAQGSPFSFSVLDVVLMGQFAHNSGFFAKPSKKSVEIAMECLQILGIEKLTRKNFSRISGGQRQMVLIARAMAQQPQFIAMDEPTSNLDLGNQMRVLKMTQILKEKGYGVIMNTHSPEQALQFGDKVIMLNSNSAARVGVPSDIIQSDTISELYSTPVEIVEAISSKGDRRKLLLTL